MSEPIFSPDGKWMWTGSDWIPSPPSHNPPTIEEPNLMENVASELGVPTDELELRSHYFDINQDGIIERSELELAGQSIVNSTPHLSAPNASNIQPPSPKNQYPNPNPPLASNIQQESQQHLGPLPPPLIPLHPSPSSNLNNNKRRKKAISIILYSGLVFALFASILLLLTVIYDVPVSSLNDTNSWADTDGDGVIDLIDDDDDNDGYLDRDDDLPLNPNEHNDNDYDGIGDNADLDDDNDATPDLIDGNPNIDMGLSVNIMNFFVQDYTDAWDDYSELYFVISVDNIEVGYIGDFQNAISMETGEWYSINSIIYFDVPESTIDDEGFEVANRYHWIGIEAWDSDAWADDHLDINPDPEWRTLMIGFDGLDDVIFDTSSYSSPRNSANGSQDSVGYDDDDASIIFEIELIDISVVSPSKWSWEYSGSTYSISQELEYNTYTQFRALDHDVGGLTDSSRARFVTPDEPYIVEMANSLDKIASEEGLNKLKTAEMVLAFVRSIDYQFDYLSAGVNEYPKYPIEMLWEGNGDCEDATHLYNSLMEAMGYDAAMILLLVKSGEDEDWGGHAMPGIYIENHDGEYVSWNSGSKEGIPFYYAEATGGDSDIGENVWYDVDIKSMLD